MNKPISLSRSILDVMPIPVAIFDVDGKLLHVNIQFSLWFTPNAAKLKNFEQVSMLINELMSNELQLILSDVMINNQSRYIREIAIRTNIKGHKTCKTSFTSIWSNDKSNGVIMFFEDKGGETENMALYKEQAQLDQLTDTLNRFGFYDAFNRVTQQCQNHKFIYAVMIADIDKLKLLNDIKGHQYGDMVIKNTAKGLSKGLRTEDILARWGGDEFIIILTNIFSENHVTKLSERLEKGVNKYNLEKNTPTSISYGLAVWKTHGESLEDLIDHADRMMYRQKQLK